MGRVIPTVRGGSLACGRQCFPWHIRLAKVRAALGRHLSAVPERQKSSEGHTYGRWHVFGLYAGDPGRRAQDTLMLMRTGLVRSVLVTAFAVAGLAGCESDSKIAAKCPSAAVLAPTSTLTAFRSGVKAEPAGALYTVGLASVRTNCAFDSDNGTTDSSLEL